MWIAPYYCSVYINTLRAPSYSPDGTLTNDPFLYIVHSPISLRGRDYFLTQLRTIEAEIHINTKDGRYEQTDIFRETFRHLFRIDTILSLHFSPRAVKFCHENFNNRKV